MPRPCREDEIRAHGKGDTIGLLHEVETRILADRVNPGNNEHLYGGSRPSSSTGHPETERDLTWAEDGASRDGKRAIS